MGRQRDRAHHAHDLGLAHEGVIGQLVPFLGQVGRGDVLHMAHDVLVFHDPQVFQRHGDGVLVRDAVDLREGVRFVAGNPVVRRQLKRRHFISFFGKLEPCLVGIEACASSHHWARELMALGHDVRLMPPAYVKPYVKRHKNDATDAEAICEAVQRPSMRFVPVKTPEQQAGLMLHRTRHLFVRQRTAVSNSIRAFLAEVGQAAELWERRGRRAEEVWTGDALRDAFASDALRDALRTEALRDSLSDR